MNSQDQFDRQAAHYNAAWNQWSESSLAWLVDHAAARKTDRLLDVATGTGFTALAFAPLVAEVVGLDVSNGMLVQARNNAAVDGIANVSWQQGTAEQLPFPADSFDLVTARVAPHHFIDIRAFVSEAFRVLRKDGRLLIADTSVPDGLPDVDQWQNRVEWLRDQSHIRNYSPAEWTQLTSTAGFRVDLVERCDEAKPITLRDWMAKSGCAGDAAGQVEQMFLDAPEAARSEFSIEQLPGGDFAFKWMRVVLAAGKP